VRCPLSALLFLWTIIQCRSAIFTSVAPHRHFLPGRNHSPLLLATMWPPRRPQTWNNFQPHRPFGRL
jgi:hypothetical protein